MSRFLTQPGVLTLGVYSLLAKFSSHLLRYTMWLDLRLFAVSVIVMAEWFQSKIGFSKAHLPLLPTRRLRRGWKQWQYGPFCLGEKIFK
jgi:hypothetical protein